MKETKIICDICGKEHAKNYPNVQVIFTTEQTEGRSCKNYIDIVSIDLCNECRDYQIMGNYIMATGAQGCNQYSFINIPNL